MSAAGADNTSANPNIIIFTIKDTKYYVAVVTLSPRDDQILSKLLDKGLNNQYIGMGMNQNVKNKKTTNEYRYIEYR